MRGEGTRLKGPWVRSGNACGTRRPGNAGSQACGTGAPAALRPSRGSLLPNGRCWFAHALAWIYKPSEWLRKDGGGVSQSSIRYRYQMYIKIEPAAPFWDVLSRPYTCPVQDSLEGTA